MTFFPRNQAALTHHPRHPRGLRREGKAMVPAGDFSPSLSFYSELCRRVQFVWRDSE